MSEGEDQNWSKNFTPGHFAQVNNVSMKKGSQKWGEIIQEWGVESVLYFIFIGLSLARKVLVFSPSRLAEYKWRLKLSCVFVF